MQSARARLAAAEARRAEAFKAFDAAAAVAQAEAPRPNLAAGLGVAIISTSRAASWRAGARATIADLGGALRSGIREAGDEVERISAEGEAMRDLAAFLRGEIPDPPAADLPADLLAAAATLRQADPGLAVTLAATIAEASRTVLAMTDRARTGQAMAACAGEVARHRMAVSLHRAAGEDRNAKAAGLLGERAACRLRDMRKAAAR